VSLADVARHDLLVVRRSLLLKSVLAALLAAPLGGVFVGFGLGSDPGFRFLLLSMWLIVGGTVPLVGVLAAAPAVAGSRDAGRLRLLLSTATERATVAGGILCSRLLLVVGSLAAGLCIGVAALVAVVPGAAPGRLAGFVVFTLLVATAYVSLGLAVSVTVDSATRALVVSVGLFVGTLLWPQIASILHGIVTDLGVAVPATASQVLGRLSPFGAYSQVISDPGAIYGVEVTTPLLGSGAMAAVLVGWATLPLAFGLRRFARTDL
jgi:ABC-type transport system involved in multi-copper enzyme maturation permease subunit